MTPAEIADSYSNLLAVERAWRTMKSVLDLRPVYHHREDRIRTHVTLCWLALLLVRIAETTTNTTWNQLTRALAYHKEMTVETPDGNFTITNHPPAETTDTYTALNIPQPGTITTITIPEPHT
ncbi:hypothetical protein [Corynebacterium cystitidis]|uniref:hypothetical protein n=1 Tax=Corynebacterium cystitidis TaxID=35757 RepID=UPI00211ECC30|nr:hypothetical protein [Corynebacterium cystitidis]